MEIDRIPEWDLSPADDAAIAALLGRSFDTDFGGRSFFQQRHHLRLVHRRGGRIVGHMALCLRAVRLGGALHDVVGLAEVATDPDHRGQGIASALLKDSIAAARDTGAEFFLLFGDAPLYAAHGFVAKPNRLHHVGLIGARTGAVAETGPDGLMVLALRDAAWDDRAILDLVGHRF